MLFYCPLLATSKRAVAKTLLEHAKPFSRASRSPIAGRLGIEPPSPGRVQAALRRLERPGLVDRQNGGWAPADAEWAGWVREAEV